MRRPSFDVYTLVPTGCLTVLVLVFLLVPPPHDNNNGLRILFFDPLSRDEPDPRLLENLTRLARLHNTSLTVLQGGEATLDALRLMMEYDIVVIRGHGARVNGTGAFVWTGETWGEAWARYQPGILVWAMRLEAVKGTVRYGNQTRYYLALSPQWFAENMMDKEKKHTIVVYIGCNTYDETLARTLIEKGALAYIGTTDYLPTPVADQLIYNITRILLADRPLLEKLYMISRLDYVGVYTVLDFYQT